ncbi:DUF86 domain-containing protein [hot springs metagenome]|uniref:DUF86 domain-containing protein n=1 Tax=hot springs metagenome TaxID=433727 RepID=A0A5J4L3E1_9ZZZZ
MKRDYKLFVIDILEAIDYIDSFVKGMSFEDFLKDEKTKSAVIWQINVIGEATKNIPKSIRAKYKDLPWKDMAGIRDKISHFYFGVNYEIVWKVIKKRLLELKPKIEQILKDLESEENNAG